LDELWDSVSPWILNQWMSLLLVLYWSQVGDVNGTVNNIVWFVVACIDVVAD